jgi:putative ABC transport system substrate-binding protein
MRRRDFITLASSAAAWPLAARAQSATPVVGFVNAADASSYEQQVAAFLKGLEDTGYIAGKNVTIEYRWADERNDRLPALLGDLVHRQVAVIAATSTPAAVAAKAATTVVPVIFETGADPVQIGLVTNLSRPGGNVTGVTPKRLQLLHELLPTTRTIALLVNPALSLPSVDTVKREVSTAAGTFGLELHILNANSENDITAAFAKAVQLRAGGVVVASSALFVAQTEQLAALALRHTMPTIYQSRRFAVAGGLISYGSEITEAYRLVGIYAGRVLKGDKPADLPVQQATKVELIINLKTAKTFGIAVPNTLIGRADEVIE